MSYYDNDRGSPPSPRAPEPSLSMVGEFQVSTFPWVTSSAVSSGQTFGISFPKVTSFITVRNAGPQDLRIGFTKAGLETGGNYFTIASGSVSTFDLKLRDLFLRSGGSYSSTFSVLAGLTMIPSKFMPILTSSLTASQGTWEGVG